MWILNRLSIRARITLCTLLLAALFFAPVALVVRQQVEVIMSSASYEVLKSDIEPFETAIQQELNDPIDNPGEGQLIAVIDPGGTTRTSTLPADLSTNSALIDPTSTGPQQITTGNTSYLVAVETAKTSTGDWTIVAARNQDAAALILAHLMTGLSTGLGALIVLFGGVSWLLTGAALRPVTHLRRSADSIRAAGSEELLPVGTAKDEITDLAATLNHLIGDLRASAARERQMVSDASHELRTPLAVLQARLELLRTAGPAELNSDLHAAERAAQRLVHLVNSLLELSSLDAACPPTPVLIKSLLDEAGEAIDRARLHAMSDNVEIQLMTPAEPEATGTVGMPELRYGRVLDNLLSNALHAVDGRGRITVTILRNRSSLVTVVTDDGPGIPSEFLPHAFDRFSQADAARGSGQGAGLGLAIVTAAASSAGGSVTLENMAPAGLTVTITLPVIQEPPDTPTESFPLRRKLHRSVAGTDGQRDQDPAPQPGGTTGNTGG